MNANVHDELAEFDELEIALRAYVPTGRKSTNWRGVDIGPSEWTLIFDTETTTDAAQTLKFGVYQVRRGDELWEAGYFFNQAALTDWELMVIRSFAAKAKYQCMPIEQFIDGIMFGIGYELRATIIGFNLPFDLSRIAINHGAARGRIMKGGFSFQLSRNRYWPNIQIKHLSPRVSLIRFTTRPGRIAGRGMRRRNLKPVPRPGYFIDLRTLAAALTSRSFNLAGLAGFLKTHHRKLETDEHGGPVTDNYLSYARNDVQVTWECYCALRDKYSEHKLLQTPAYRIFSEASIGKAYFKEMNIQPWRQLQPDFPDQLLGFIMSSYFGGRAEVHHRRMISTVRYCDFKSMYPTVCTLMGLWRYVIANGLKWKGCTRETRKLLKSVTLTDLQDKSFWPKLTTLVQVAPAEDIFPVRASYGGDQQSTIGLNYLSSETPLWFTLADCIASKLLTGKAPKIVRAIRFEPDGVQSSLKPVEICGNAAYPIDPYKDDFYCRIIDLRSEVKSGLQDAPPADRAILESTQFTLKILANATSYGNFVELNVEDLTHPRKLNCYGYSGDPFSVKTSKIEEPGRYFHPLIGTLITGAARLMLAMTERLVLDAGLDWALCDTDSMAIAKPEDMGEAEFNTKVEAIRSWFEPLNPYAEKGPLLKLEDVNFGLAGGTPTKETEPLYSLAVSAKRYALFNLTPDGEIVIRKASAHGLGHLLAPYPELEAPPTIPAPATPLDQVGVDRWQYDLWHQIIRAALKGHPDQVDLDYHPNLNFPAASRYGATTPNLLDWFKIHNERRSYSDQVRPSNFMLAFQISPAAIHEYPEFFASIAGKNPSRSKPVRLPKPVAPFDRSPARAAEACFDRDTGIVVPVGALKTYIDALVQYHLRPEHKFLNGNYTGCGITKRRHVKPAAIRNIGKESNRWEEQFYLGGGEGTEIEYGLAPQDSKLLLENLRAQIIMFGQRKIARKTGISRRTICRFLNGLETRREITDRLFRVVNLGDVFAP